MENFEIIRPLGSGKKRKFNEVFLVRDQHSGEEAVLKYLEKSEQNSAAQDLLRREAALVFDHPLLPRVIRLGETEKALFLLKKYVPGIPLDAYWKQLPVKERLPFLLLLLDQLLPLFEELRIKKLVHGDIKPSNILVNDTEAGTEVALIDFGLAFYPEKTAGRNLVFALGFSAPELILNRLALADHTTDIFSLGISIALLFEGKLPLSHPNPAVMTNLQLTHPLVQTPRVPKKIFPVLARMCHKASFPKPPQLLPEKTVESLLKEGQAKRYQNLAEVSDALLEILEKDKKSWFSGLVKIFANPHIKGKE